MTSSAYKLQRSKVRCFCRQVLTMLHPRLKSRGFTHGCNKYCFSKILAVENKLQLS